MKITDILYEGFKEVKQKYIDAGNDQNEINQSIEKFRHLVNKNQLQGDERNIDWWGKNKSFAEFQKHVDHLSSQKTTTSIKRSKNVGKSVTIHETDEWLVVVPLDKDASCFYGKGSSWCTTKPLRNHFESYFYNSEIVLIYTLNKKTGGMWAIAGHKSQKKMEMFDQDDNAISGSEFQSSTGFNPKNLLAKALEHDDKLSSSRSNYKGNVSELRAMMDSFDFKARDSKIEALLSVTKEINLCGRYLVELNRANIPENEFNSIPEVIAIAAIGQNYRLIFLFSAPKPSYIDAAMEAQPDAVDDLLEKYHTKLTPRNVMIMIRHTAKYDLNSVLRYMSDLNVQIPQQAIDERCNKDMTTVFTFARNGFKTKLEYYKKMFDLDPFNVRNRLDDLVRLGDDEILKMAVEAAPDAAKFIKNIDSKTFQLAVENSREVGDLLLHVTFNGYFPSKDDQQLLGGKVDTRALINRSINTLKSHLKSDKITIKSDFIDRIKKLKLNIDNLEQAKNSDRAKTDDSTVTMLDGMISDVRNDIEKVTIELKSLLNQKETTKRNLNSLISGVKNIGFI